MGRSCFTVFFLIVFVFLQMTCFAQSERLSITYLANEGFLVHNGDAKILIDGLFTNGWGKYHIPTAGTLLKMENAEPPFDNIQVMFISHNHQDHFNANLVAKYLGKNGKTILFTSDAVKEELLRIGAASKTIRTIGAYESRIKIGEKEHLKITLMDIPHADDPTNEVENIGCVITTGAFTIFFPGDALSNDVNIYKKLKLSDYKIDVLFSPKWFFTNEYGAGGAKIIKYINPAYIIGMHIESAKYDYYKKIVKESFGGNKVIFLESELSKVIFTKNNDEIYLELK